MTTEQAIKTVTSNYSVGAARALAKQHPEKVLAAGYEILHGCKLERPQRIDLLRALAALEDLLYQAELPPVAGAGFAHQV